MVQIKSRARLEQAGARALKSGAIDQATFNQLVKPNVSKADVETAKTVVAGLKEALKSSKARAGVASEQKALGLAQTGPGGADAAEVKAQLSDAKALKSAVAKQARVHKRESSPLVEAAESALGRGIITKSLHRVLKDNRPSLFSIGGAADAVASQRGKLKRLEKLAAKMESVGEVPGADHKQAIAQAKHDVYLAETLRDAAMSRYNDSLGFIEVVEGPKELLQLAVTSPLQLLKGITGHARAAFS